MFSARLLFLSLILLMCACGKKTSDTTQSGSTPVAMCASPAPASSLKDLDTTRQIAPLLTNLGDYGFRISTSNNDAQKFFNQGLNLYYGFNHLEAYRSFREAARLDPSCAMCWWGQALSLGPNINAPMDPSDASVVYKAVRRAQVNASGATPVEQGLVDAIAKRYTEKAPADRTSLDEAYANAMRSLSAKFPHVNEVTTLTAEALMDLHPWDYWLRSGDPQLWTAEILMMIDKVIARSPRHPGANHLNIHIREASTEPGTATTSADLLRDLVPGSGHLVHMPSHIYIRTGRYADGILANQKAVDADEDYVSTCRAQGIYPLAYYPHNYHFYWACAQMSGRGELALEVSRKLVSKMAVSLMGTQDWITLQHYYVTPWYSMVRFSQWDALDRESRPADSLKYALSIWHYAKGIGAVRQNKMDEATTHLKELQSLAADPALENQKIWAINSFAQVLAIASLVLEGELLAAQKNYKGALAALETALANEEDLLYQEPPDWYFPVRETLGAVLLQAGSPKEAEKRFLEDLTMYPENGWALSGLYRALKAQGRIKEANEVKTRFDKAFADADASLKSL